MALWNAPTPLEHHPTLACEGVLACVEATEKLFASAAWAGRKPWRTRFGIHRAEVKVGHFGAPDRMSFTVMGDGVNLASRLEGLNKQYGTRMLVSAAVEREARQVFWFRRLDRVAVKGKHQGVEVYELLGRRCDMAKRGQVIVRYEQALEAYFDRRFAEALALLADASGDGPSEVLAGRCRRLHAEPPPSDWDGVYVAKEK
jgi:adenylate cyclase